MTPIEIGAIRFSMSLTQEEFSARTGISLQTLSRWERGISTPKGASLTLLLLLNQKGTGILNMIEEARLYYAS